MQPIDKRGVSFRDRDFFAGCDIKNPNCVPSSGDTRAVRRYRQSGQRFAHVDVFRLGPSPAVPDADLRIAAGRRDPIVFRKERRRSDSALVKVKGDACPAHVPRQANVRIERFRPGERGHRRRHVTDHES